jgi:hypothetical protein
MTSTETGHVTGTMDNDYNLTWFTEACLSNTLRLETRRRVPRWAAVIIVLLGMLGVIGGSWRPRSRRWPHRPPD